MLIESKSGIKKVDHFSDVHQHATECHTCFPFLSRQNEAEKTDVVLNDME